MKCFFLLVMTHLMMCAKAQTSGVTEPFKPEPYNFILGTNTIGGKYQFTNESKLLEQARQVRSMGSNILKISLGEKSPVMYGLKLDIKPVHTLQLFRSHEDYRKVFDMDFRYIFMWVHTLTGIEWKKGIDAAQEKVLYDEMYQFVSYLLKEFDYSGKTFLIGNWEGDWLLHPNYDRKATPAPDHIANMTRWFQIRQRAIEDARAAVPHQNVDVFHYIEVNLALKSLKGEHCITHSILPQVNVDLVSYSSYEAIKNRSYEVKKAELNRIFEHIESKLKPNPSIPFQRRVFIGEYGYHASIKDPESFQKQYDETQDIMKISLELNIPFALHWQMYNNEYEADGTSKQMSLINEQGEKMPLYHLHQQYYIKMNQYLCDYKKSHKRYPSVHTFREKAMEVMKDLDHGKMSTN